MEEGEQEDGAEGVIYEGDVDTVVHMGTMRRKFVDVVATRISQGCKAHEETDTTFPPRDLRSMSRMPLSIQPSTAYTRLSAVDGLLRCCMVPKNQKLNIIMSLEDVQHVWKMVWLWGCRDTEMGMGGAGSNSICVNRYPV